MLVIYLYKKSKQILILSNDIVNGAGRCAQSVMYVWSYLPNINIVPVCFKGVSKRVQEIKLFTAS